jgi:hypothetical protein
MARANPKLAERIAALGVDPSTGVPESLSTA